MNDKIYVVTATEWLGDDYDGYEREYIILMTHDKSLADKVIEHNESYSLTTYYGENYTVEMNKVEYMDLELEVKKLESQIKVRDKEILNREKIIKQQHNELLSYKNIVD